MSDFFEGHEVPSLSLKGNNSTKTLALSLYHGNVGFTVWDTEAGGKGPVFRASINVDLLTAIRKNVDKLLQSGPETKLPLVVSKWSPDEKKFNKQFVLQFIKNGEQVYQIQLSFKKNGAEQNLIFDFMAGGGIASGSDPMTKAAKSELRFLYFKHWLNVLVPYAIVLTKKKYQSQNKPAPVSKSNASAGSGDSFF